jgi:hypothetical protein
MSSAEETLANDVKLLKGAVLGVTVENFTDILRQLHAFDTRLSDAELSVSSEPEQSESVRRRGVELKQVREEFIAVKALFRNLNRTIELASKLELMRGEDGEERSSALTRLNQLEASRKYTESLKNSFELLRKEVELNRANSESLVDANQTIAKIADVSSTYRGDVGQSHSLITQLKRRDMIDKAMVLTALAVFCLVVLYILNKRVGMRFYYMVSWLYSLLFSEEGEVALLHANAVAESLSDEL